MYECRITLIFIYLPNSRPSKNYCQGKHIVDTMAKRATCVCDLRGKKDFEYFLWFGFLFIISIKSKVFENDL